MPRVGGALDIVQVSDPGTPVAGRQFLYFKSDGFLYTKTPAGVVTRIGAIDSPFDIPQTSTPATPATGFTRFYAKVDGRVYSTGPDGVERGPFGAEGKYDSRKALRPFTYALAPIATKPLDILFLGDSITEGYYAASDAKRFVAIVRNGLQKAFNPATVPGGEGFIPGYHNGASLADRWTMGGGWTDPGFGNIFGIGRRSRPLMAAGQTASITVSCDRFWLLMTQTTNGGNFTVTIDGGAPSAPASTWTASSTITSMMWDSGQLTRGSHTVTVTAATDAVHGTAQAILEGIMVFDGDGGAAAGAGKGVRVWEGGHSGFQTSDYYGPDQSTAGYWANPVGTIVQPDLTVVALGGNDLYTGGLTPAQFRTNYQQLITYLKTKTTGAILLVAYHKFSAISTAAWQAYVDVIQNLAISNGVGFFDAGAVLPVPTSGTLDDFYYDGTHPTEAGQAILGQAILNYIVDEVSPASTGAQGIDTYSAQSIYGAKAFVGVVPMSVVAPGSTTAGAGIGFGTESGGFTGFVGTHGSIFQGTTDGANGDLEVSAGAGKVLRCGVAGSLTSLAITATAIATSVPVTAPSFTSGLTGALVPNRYVGATSGGPPATGTFNTGDWVMTTAGGYWVCTAGGSPGTWKLGVVDAINGGTNIFRIDDGTAPTSSVAGGTGLLFFSQGGRGKVRDGVGNVCNLDGPISPSRLSATVANATTTLATTGLTCPLQPGTYEFVCNGSYTSSATTTGIQFAGAFSGTSTAFSLGAMVSTAPTTSNAGAVAALGTKVPLAATVGPAAAQQPFQLTGSIVVTAAGTLTLQFAAGAAGTVTLQIGSYLKTSRL